MVGARLCSAAIVGVIAATAGVLIGIAVVVTARAAMKRESLSCILLLS